MSNEDQNGMNRRSLLQSAAGLVALAASGQLVLAPAPAQAGVPKARGRPGDFDFLAGEWKIRNRRFKPDTKVWDEFEGEATCWTILGGVGSVEELRIPARQFSGMGLRLLDVEKALWSDFWVNAKSGVLSTPGMNGAFQDGAGIFEADDVDGEQPIKVRGVWDRITSKSCRWHQAVSRDGGKSWEENWFMDWTRA